MKRVSVKEIATEVAALLGESILPECTTEESPFPDIEDRVRILSPGLLNELIMEAEVSKIMKDTARISATPEIDANGVVTIPCPDDFLRLVYAKMSDWKRPVTRLGNQIENIIGRQSSKWSGIRGNPERPVVLADVNSDGKPCLRMYSSKEGERISSCLYMKRPAIDTQGYLEIPDALYYPLLQKVTPSITLQMMR